MDERSGGLAKLGWGWLEGPKGPFAGRDLPPMIRRIADMSRVRDALDAEMTAREPRRRRVSDDLDLQMLHIAHGDGRATVVYLLDLNESIAVVGISHDWTSALSETAEALAATTIDGQRSADHELALWRQQGEAIDKMSRRLREARSIGQGPSMRDRGDGMDPRTGKLALLEPDVRATKAAPAARASESSGAHDAPVEVAATTGQAPVSGVRASEATVIPEGFLDAREVTLGRLDVDALPERLESSVGAQLFARIEELSGQASLDLADGVERLVYLGLRGWRRAFAAGSVPSIGRTDRPGVPTMDPERPLDLGVVRPGGSSEASMTLVGAVVCVADVYEQLQTRVERDDVIASLVRLGIDEIEGKPSRLARERVQVKRLLSLVGDDAYADIRGRAEELRSVERARRARERLAAADALRPAPASPVERSSSPVATDGDRVAGLSTEAVAEVLQLVDDVVSGRGQVASGARARGLRSAIVGARMQAAEAADSARASLEAGDQGALDVHVAAFGRGASMIQGAGRRLADEPADARHRYGDVARAAAASVALEMACLRLSPLVSNAPPGQAIAHVLNAAVGLAPEATSAQVLQGAEGLAAHYARSVQRSAGHGLA